jgi:hypothetical protein
MSEFLIILAVLVNQSLEVGVYREIYIYDEYVHVYRSLRVCFGELAFVIIEVCMHVYKPSWLRLF